MPELFREQKISLVAEFSVLKIWIESSLSADKELSPEDNKLLRAFAPTRQKEEIDYLLNHTTQKGNNLLSIAAIKGKSIVANILLDQNIDTYRRNNHGQTPFSLACENGHLDVAKILYSKNPDLANIKCKAGHSPIDYAAYKKKFDIVEYLFDQDFEQINKIVRELDGYPIYVNDYVLIYDGDNLDFRKKFLLTYSNVNHEVALTKTKDTALIRYLKTDDLESAEILLRRDDVDLTVKNKQGHSCFYIAAKKSDSTTVKGQEFLKIARNIVNKSISMNQDIDLYDEKYFLDPNIKEVIFSQRPPKESFLKRNNTELESTSAEPLLKRSKVHQ